MDSDNSFGIFKLFLPLPEHLSSTPIFVGKKPQNNDLQITTQKTNDLAP
jgi:hypothetical protein